MSTVVLLIFAFIVAASARRRELSSFRGLDQPGVCPCEDKSLCKPVSKPIGQELYGFSSKGWQSFNWSAITTIAWPDLSGSNAQLLCVAHSHRVRLVLGAPSLGEAIHYNATQRTAYASSLANSIADNFLDGVTFDYEDQTYPDSAAATNAGYVALVAASKVSLVRSNPYASVSVCVGWRPGADFREYDYVGLAEAAGLLYVMDYDTRSQILDRCIASANSPLPKAAFGPLKYMNLGISASSIILGIPFYGYNYPCVGTLPNDTAICPIKPVPFRSVACSDASGSETPFSVIMSIVAGRDTAFYPVSTPVYDADTASWWVNARPHGQPDVLHQIWYDGPESVAAKVAAARASHFRGIGPFTWSDLDPSGASGNPRAPGEAAAVYRALGRFLE